MNMPFKFNFKALQSTLIKNSAWGIVSNFLQVLFVSAFFVIVARKYTPTVFAQFLIATTVYQLVAAFSTMGLGQWFIRQYEQEQDKVSFTSKFLKTQSGLGLLFYLVNIALAYIIYPDGEIRLLCIILGTNVIFDNFINAIRSLNIAEYQQQKTAVILIIDGFLKLLVGCLLFINPFSAVVLSVFMIVVRIVTLGLFIRVGSSNKIDLKLLWRAEISYADIKNLILKNWQFIVIGSISIVYWRISNIIISKSLPLTDVADYEIAFRIFSVLQILPVVASATVYPQFIKYFNNKDFVGLRKFYKDVYMIYSVFAISSYAFIYTFADLIIPTAFGDGYPGAIPCLQEMFLTFLFLPTLLLQANLIVAIGLEKEDMRFNVLSFTINVVGCLIGLNFVKDLSVVNYVILLSFMVFHISQDTLLIKQGITTLSNCLIAYGKLSVFMLFYHYIHPHVNSFIFFPSFVIILVCTSILIRIFQNRDIQPSNRFGTALTGK